MRRGVGVGLLVLVLGMLAIGLSRPAPAPPVGDVVLPIPKSERVVLRSGPAGSAAEPTIDEPMPVEGMEDDAEPSSPRVPTSPAEEGLFAWADATGMAVIRCPLAQLPEGFEPLDDDVVTDGTVSRMVSPNDTPGWSAGIVHLGERGYVESHRGAFVGAVGECRITLEDEPIQIRFTPEQLAALAASVNEEHSTVLDDVEDTMHPLQVALETPGLSPPARAWLTAKLAATEADAADVEAAPLSVEAREKQFRAVNAVTEPTEG